MQTVFKSKHKIIAEFMSYMTNSVISKDKKGNLVLINKSEMDEMIAQFLENNDFISMGELLGNAKKNLSESINEGSDYVPKSIRSPFITNLKYHEVSQKKNISLSDVIRITSVPAMKNKLDEFRDMPSVDPEKLRGIYDLLENWKEKKPTSPNKEYDLGYYDMTDDMKDLFEKFMKFSIYNICKKHEFPIELMKEYLNSNAYINWENTYPEVILKFDSQSDLFKLSVIWRSETFFLQKYQEFKENIGPELHKKFDDVLGFDIKNYYEKGDVFNSDLYGISGKIHIDNNKLFFEGAEVRQRNALNALIYTKITDEKFTDSEIVEYKKQLHEALALNDYDTAALLNEKLVENQLFSKVAVLYGDIISRVVEETNVITFTIPKLLLMLWETAKGDRKIPEFLERNIVN